MARKTTDITEELIASMREAATIARGETEPARVHLPLAPSTCWRSGSVWALPAWLSPVRFGLAVVAEAVAQARAA